MHTNTSWMHLLVLESRSLIAWLDTLPTARRLFDGSIDAAAYARYLVQMYHYVRWTTPFVGQAGRRITQTGRHPALAGLLIKKAAEERNNEQRLLADLLALGWTAERVEATAPSPAVAAYVTCNHRITMRDEATTAFLGTTYLLESLSAQHARITVGRLLTRGTIPNIRKASSFLTGHANADENSISNLGAVLRLLSDPAEQEAILLSATMARTLCMGLFQPPASRWSGVDATCAPPV